MLIAPFCKMTASFDCADCTVILQKGAINVKIKLISKIINSDFTIPDINDQLEIIEVACKYIISKKRRKSKRKRLK